MKKTLHYIILLLVCTFSFNLKAQTSGYWTNPINGVPFEILSLDPTLSNDTMIVEFSGELTYMLDSNSGAKLWNPISPDVYQAIFGYDAPLQQGTFFPTYFELFTISFDANAFDNAWPVTIWDTLIAVEPWIDDRTINLSSADMGAIVGWDWNSSMLNLLSAKRILDPTVPVIEGEDMDFSLIPGNMAFDIDDALTPVQKNQLAIDSAIYVFNKQQFTETYDDFVVWMIDTKPFFPNSFDFDTYHDWLYEYFNPIAQTRVTEIISTKEYKNDITLFKVSENIYQLSGTLSNNTYRILDVQGKLIEINKLTNDNQIDISNLSKGIYFLNIQFKGHHSVHKIIK